MLTNKELKSIKINMIIDRMSKVILISGTAFILIYLFYKFISNNSFFLYNQRNEFLFITIMLMFYILSFIACTVKATLFWITNSKGRNILNKTDAYMLNLYYNDRVKYFNIIEKIIGRNKIINLYQYNKEKDIEARIINEGTFNFILSLTDNKVKEEKIIETIFDVKNTKTYEILETLFLIPIIIFLIVSGVTSFSNPLDLKHKEENYETYTISMSQSIDQNGYSYLNNI